MSRENKKNCTLPIKLQYKHGKNYLNLFQKFERKMYSPLDAFSLLVDNVKKEQAVEVVFVLGIDPKKSDQVTKGVLKVVPNGLGKNIKIGVFAKTNVQDYLNAGATFVGFEDLIADIKAEKIDADVFIAPNELMPELAKLGLGRILKGKMPNPKLGTVVLEKDLLQAVKEQKSGQLAFRSQGCSIQCRIGNTSFSAQNLHENYLALREAVELARPSVIKPHTYLKKIFISSSMSPSLQLLLKELEEKKK